MQNIGFTVTAVITAALTNLVSFIPQFIGGLIILIIGLISAAFLREVVLRFFAWVRVEQWFESANRWLKTVQTERSSRSVVWINILAELVRWTVVILFLVPAAEAWGLPKVTDVLNQLLFYLPNVFVAVVVGFIGLIIANLIHSIVKSAASEMGSDSSKLLADVARYAMIFFTALVVLNQLGVAADLVRILFTGIVAMLALAGGIAFGLGGQDTAQRSLESFRERLESPQVRVAATNVVRSNGRVANATKTPKKTPQKRGR